MAYQDLIPHLFRIEFSKITAVLCKRFGIEHIEIAEDIASDTFLLACETWGYKGIPANPTAWLYTVAKNKAINRMQRNRLFAEKIAPQLKNEASGVAELEFDWSEQHSADSQLQMLFALCHPAIAPEAQVGLALRILCGFGIDEIADAFLTSKETVNKRLSRAREKLRLEAVKMEMPGPAEINKRLETVLTTLYLLFNEGYYSESRDTLVRNELCIEAMRLTYLLRDNKETNLPNVNALLALMCFHASRFDARKSENGAFILYQDQDESRWNYELIAKGGYFLNQATQGDKLSSYHIEASIAYWHTIKTDTAEKWEHILQLYNQLLIANYSPIAALNRTYALSKVKGNAVALAEAEKLKLTTNHFYFVLLGELYKGIDDVRAVSNFQQAYQLAKTNTDKLTIQGQLDRLQAN